MGCEVVVFSGTNSKEGEARKLGAREFVAMKGVDKLKIKPVNHLVVTTSAQPDWKLYVSFMVFITNGSQFRFHMRQVSLRYGPWRHNLPSRCLGRQHIYPIYAHDCPRTSYSRGAGSS